MFGKIKLRHGQPSVELDESEFKRVFKQTNFYDPRFEPMANEIEKLAQIAYQNYKDHRKAPITVKAGAGASDPGYDLSVEWVQLRNELNRLQAAHATAPLHILLISGSSRNEHTCPGEMSKSYRLVEKAKAVIEAAGVTVELLDLSRVTAEYGKKIHPCKACVSTSMALCHWPCSCYPNHSLAQTNDWMTEIYPKWVKAHGVMIITPVHWYQSPSPFKLMMDRLVCADGGNPDPSSTHGKNASEAKELEMKGWDYPKHLAGRAFAVVTHGDSAGTESSRRVLTDWLADMELIQAGSGGVLEGYIGYYKPYATSHDELDKNPDFVKEVEIAAKSLVHRVQDIRNGFYRKPDQGLEHPMQK